MELKPLPIGIQEFEKIVTEGRLYVDKTEYIYRLITGGVVYFLSRPRRFGKSLLVSTLEAIFKGQRDLFRGLWIHGSDYDWRPYPVIRMDLSVIQADTAAGVK
ncbi:MAG TPA: AAA family ATPase, partial [Anaerolineae bacterium]|nr:AAA family ATPase [Anaerolineae bacterium]